MSETHDPQSREELSGALAAVHAEAEELFESVPADGFFDRPEDGVWSPGENVIHLIRSVKAVADAMKLPKLVLRVLFGAGRGSRSYGDVIVTYLSALQGGAKASGRFVPPAVSPDSRNEAEQARSRALAGWKSAGRGLIAALAKWSEADLDRFRLPHPVLGKLTVREMLFFTHYHDLRHMETVRRISGSSG